MKDHLNILLTKRVMIYKQTDDGENLFYDDKPTFVFYLKFLLEKVCSTKLRNLVEHDPKYDGNIYLISENVIIIKRDNVFRQM